MTRDSFVFYRSFQEAANALSTNRRLTVYSAVIDYALNGVLPELKGVEFAVFALIKPVIDKNNQLYINGRKGAKDGKKGGRPPKEKPQENPKKTPKGLSAKTPSPSNDVDEAEEEAEAVDVAVDKAEAEENAQARGTDGGRLTDKEYKELCDAIGKGTCDYYIERVKAFRKRKPQADFDVKATILKWQREDKTKEQANKPQEVKKSYTAEQLNAQFADLSYEDL